MIRGNRWHIIPSLVLLLITWLSGPGCIKDLSYEGETIHDTTTSVNPGHPADDTLPVCPICVGSDTLSLSKWSFKIDSTLFCGDVTNAIISPDKTAFTFFGPSACSHETGLVMTVYLNGVIFGGDLSGISTDHVVFEYYGPGNKDIYLSRPLPGFTLTISKYNPQTRIASGSFEGFAATQKGDVVLINEGKFVIKFQ